MSILGVVVAAKYGCRVSSVTGVSDSAFIGRVGCLLYCSTVIRYEMNWLDTVWSG